MLKLFARAVETFAQNFPRQRGIDALIRRVCKAVEEVLERLTLERVGANRNFSEEVPTCPGAMNRREVVTDVRCHSVEQRLALPVLLAALW